MSDLIRRQDVLKICDKYNGQGWVWSMIRKEVEELPCDGCCTAHSGYEAGMNREEAINIMSQMIKDEEGFLSDNTVEAHKMALKALEQDNVLDKIRAEIEVLIEWHDCPIEYDNGNDAWYREACNQAIEIIDKYKAESEPQESEDLGDYPDTIHNQFDNMTGSMNL